MTTFPRREDSFIWLLPPGTPPGTVDTRSIVISGVSPDPSAAGNSGTSCAPSRAAPAVTIKTKVTLSSAALKLALNQVFDIAITPINLRSVKLSA
jgi:hypothetical protein